MKLRRGSDGLHLFDRASGINILLDEVEVPHTQRSRAPRFVSFALTNLCDLHCPFCYAPKQPARLNFDQVLAWSLELDANGCLGIGFGGGEPTLFPCFSELCVAVSQFTQLSVGFTTHAHRFTPALRDELTGAVHFIRVSMDGVGNTYEQIRRRPFSQFIRQLRIVRDTTAFGINYVVNDGTVDDLDEAADLVFAAGAKELLLLPVHSTNGLSQSTQETLLRWVKSQSRSVRLSISESGAIDGMPLADPFPNERGTKAYIHVSAFGMVSRTSYTQEDAVPIIGNSGILAAIASYDGEPV